MPLDRGDYSWWAPIINTMGDEIILPDGQQIKGKLRDNETVIEVHADDWDETIAVGATLVIAGVPHTIAAISPKSLRTRRFRIRIVREAASLP